SGRVTGYQNRPVANLLVGLGCDAICGAYHSTTTGADGRFTFTDLEPGIRIMGLSSTPDITNAPRTLSAFSWPIFTTDPHQPDPSFDLPLGVAAFNGTVHDSNGVPIPGVVVAWDVCRGNP